MNTIIENQLIGFKRLSDSMFYSKSEAEFKLVTKRNGKKSNSFVILEEIITKYKWRYIIRCSCGKDSEMRKDHFEHYIKKNNEYFCSSCQQRGDRNHFWSSKNPINWTEKEENKDKKIESYKKQSITKRNFTQAKRDEISIKTHSKERNKNASDSIKEKIRKIKLENPEKYILWRRKLKGMIIKSRAHFLVEEQLSKNNIQFKSEFILEGHKNYRYDIHLLNTNILIEINGDKIHANPLIYKADDFIIDAWHAFYAKDRWEYDKNKTLYAEEKNYNVLSIWTSEIYKKDFNIMNILSCAKRKWFPQ